MVLPATTYPYRGMFSGRLAPSTVGLARAKKHRRVLRDVPGGVIRPFPSWRPGDPGPLPSGVGKRDANGRIRARRFMQVLRVVRLASTLPRGSGRCLTGGRRGRLGGGMAGGKKVVRSARMLPRSRYRGAGRATLTAAFAALRDTGAGLPAVRRGLARPLH
jgi:hypothetical protein